MLYNVVSVSAVHHESATLRTHIPSLVNLPSAPSTPSLQDATEHSAQDPERGMGKGGVADTDDGILLSREKERNWATCSNVGEPKASYGVEWARKSNALVIQLLSHV